MTKLIPAILTNNAEDFEKKVRQVENFTDIIHLDVCDGIFVPQKTVTLEDIQNIKTTAQFEAHLMVQNPTEEIEKWYKLPNIKKIIFHLETAKIPPAVVEHIEGYGFKAGVAANPETSPEDIKGIGYEADGVFFLAVHPGLQGQKFILETIEKIRAFRADHPDTPVAIDGGVHTEELQLLKDLDLDYIILGSEIFNHPTPGEHLQELQKIFS